MADYQTYDYLPDLTPQQMALARKLTLSRETSPSLSQWENSVIFATVEDYAILRDIFVFNATKEATYQVLSSSFFDPFILQVYDNLGNVIAFDQDGGTYGFDYATFKAPYSGVYYIRASWDQGSAPQHKAVGVSVYEDLDTIPPHPQNQITGTAANDRIIGTDANDVVNAGGGVDTFVVTGAKSQYSYWGNGTAITLSEKADARIFDTLQGIERIAFSDVTVSFETAGPAAEAYRLYQAAFGRTPDKGGLGYWVSTMSQGASLKSVANEFVKSTEFITLYASDLSTKGILTGIYKNVLHRAPDQAGFDYWLKMLDAHTVSVADMLVSFSESAENQVQVVGVLQSGFEWSNP